MPHLSTIEIEDVAATTLVHRIPTLVDNFYVASPLFKMLDAQNRIVADGGTRVEQPFIFARGPGGSYRGFDSLDITRRRTKSLLVFEWSQYYSAVTIDGLTRLRASGVNNVIDLVEAELQAAEIALKDDLGVDTFLDGTGNFGKALVGLDAAINTTGTYGGIDRATDLEGTAIRGNRDTTGGTLTLPAIQSSWGDATFGNEHPNLIVTSQNLFDQLWMRLQPQQRAPNLSAGGELLANAGFAVIHFNGVPVVVDQRCPAGTLWILNTNYIKLVPHVARANIEVQGPIPSVNQDARVWHLFWMGQLVVQSPRMQAVMTGLSES